MATLLTVVGNTHTFAGSMSLPVLVVAGLMSATHTSSSTPDSWRLGFETGKGFVIEREGEHKLALRLRGQFLYSVNAADGDAGHAVQFRRARVAFVGHVFGKANTYKMELAISPRDVATRDSGPSTSLLLDLYFRFAQFPNASIQVGQYKVPFSRERVTSSGNLAMVDRSIANAEFNVDRDVGFDIRTKDAFGLGFLRYYVGAYAGKGRNSFRPSKFDYMVLGRLELLPLGLFKDYRENDLPRTADPKVSLGFAYAYVDDAARDRGILGAAFDDDEATMDFHNGTADVLFVWRGYALFGALHVRRGVAHDGDPGTPRNGWGWTIQPAYLLSDIDLEVSARFAGILPRGSSSLRERRSVGGAVSYYFVDHSMKLQADFHRIWEGRRFSNADDAFRLQLQASF